MKIFQKNILMIRCSSKFRRTHTIEFPILKRDFYRPFTTLLDALCIQQGFHESSPWQIIRKLHAAHVISDELEIELLHAIDTLGFYRMTAFITYGKQNHTIYPARLQGSQQDQTLYYEEEQKLLQLLHVLFNFQNEAAF